MNLLLLFLFLLLQSPVPAGLCLFVRIWTGAEAQIGVQFHDGSQQSTCHSLRPATSLTLRARSSQDCRKTVGFRRFGDGSQRKSVGFRYLTVGPRTYAVRNPTVLRRGPTVRCRNPSPKHRNPSSERREPTVCGSLAAILRQSCSEGTVQGSAEYKKKAPASNRCLRGSEHLRSCCPMLSRTAISR